MKVSAGLQANSLWVKVDINPLSTLYEFINTVLKFFMKNENNSISKKDKNKKLFEGKGNLR